MKGKIFLPVLIILLGGTNLGPAGMGFLSPEEIGCTPNKPPVDTQLARLPRGEWRFSAGPTVRPGHETIPVDVINVTTDARRGLAVTRVGLKNRSAKTVRAVRLAWDLFEQSDPDRILLHGQTPLLWLPNPLPAGEKVTLEQLIVSFAEIHKSLLAPGSDTLRGDYRLEVSVSEILYEDGSRWTREPDPERSSQPSPKASSPVNKTRIQESGYPHLMSSGPEVNRSPRGVGGS